MGRLSAEAGGRGPKGQDRNARALSLETTPTTAKLPERRRRRSHPSGHRVVGSARTATLGPLGFKLLEYLGAAGCPCCTCGLPLELASLKGGLPPGEPKATERDPWV